MTSSNLALAQMAFEDAYLTLQDVDGIKWADLLRTKMHAGINDGNLMGPNELSWLNK